MARNYLPLLVTMLIAAAIFRDDFSFTLLYFFAGAYVIGTWWAYRSLASVRFRRKFTDRAFIGETINVKLEITNHSFLPVPWLRVHEGLPVDLSGPESFQRITTLGSKGKASFEYNIEARRRGYFPIGPIFLSSNDILGLSDNDQRLEGELERLTVYPKIIPLTNVDFQSRSPLGTLRHHQPVFEDPTRVMGKRDYIPGDSLRRVDWKSTAVTGRMQVRLFEPSIALETVILLNLNVNDYEIRRWIMSTELGIVISASLANWVVSKKQNVGLLVNGKDPLAADSRPNYIPARSGRGHLMRILDILARIQAGECPHFAETVRNQRVHLPWGTTLTIVTGNVEDDLFDELHQSRKAGLNVNLILSGLIPRHREIRFQAEHFGVPVVNITNEDDMVIWQQ
jgi:uncharacterized protein (DUF58 family)